MWFFEKLNKIDKLLEKLIKRKRLKTQINKIREKKAEITTHTNEIQKIIREFFVNLYPNKLKNLE
jgi:hypothetical protein